MSKKFTLTVKNGDYKYNEKSGSYEHVDLVETFKDSEGYEAISAFFEQAYEPSIYDSGTVEVTLKFVGKVPKRDKKDRY